MTEETKAKIKDSLAKKREALQQEITLTQVTPATVNPTAEPQEQMMRVSDVKKLIAETIANMQDTKKPINPKKITEHHAHLWRLDGKWVVDFVNRNNDPYIHKAIHAYTKYNAEIREQESWIELIFDDGSHKDISLKNYVSNRTPIYCKILKTNKEDKTYSLGEVEVKKEVGDKQISTGVMIDQIVEQYDYSYDLITPEGEEFTVPSYVIC